MENQELLMMTDAANENSKGNFNNSKYFGDQSRSQLRETNKLEAPSINYLRIMHQAYS